MLLERTTWSRRPSSRSISSFARWVDQPARACRPDQPEAAVQASQRLPSPPIHPSRRRRQQPDRTLVVIRRRRVFGWYVTVAVNKCRNEPTPRCTGVLSSDTRQHTPAWTPCALLGWSPGLHPQLSPLVCVALNLRLQSPFIHWKPASSKKSVLQPALPIPAYLLQRKTLHSSVYQPPRWPSKGPFLR